MADSREEQKNLGENSIDVFDSFKKENFEDRRVKMLFYNKISY